METHRPDDNWAGPQLMPGEQVGRYRIVDRLGEGGAGAVYRAVDIELARDVALKFLPRSASTAGRECIKEARSTAAVNHPSVIGVYDVGKYQDFPYLVLEYVAGEPLDRILNQGPLPARDVLDIAIQLIDALAAIHAAGMLHCDLKPSNVIIEENGKVRLIDLGAAFHERDETVLAGVRIGTTAYMSPEQLMGKPLSAASDVYSLGVVVFEMLTGRRPFQENYDAALAFAVINESPPELVGLAPETPPDMARLVSQLLAKAPQDRPGPLAELKSRCESIRVGLEKGAAGILHTRRERARLAGVVVTSVALAIVAWMLFVQPHHPESSEPVRLAVLPFTNRGAETDAYFVDGVADAIAVRLSKLGDLQVISSSSTREYRDTAMPVDEIADQLGVTYIVGGTVYWEKDRDGNKVRVDASLTRIGDKSYLWAESYVRDLGDIFKLQAEIALSVSEALRVRVGKEGQRRMAAVPTTNLEAYDFFLRGNVYFNRSWNQEDIHSATAMYRRAVTLDPRFALAHAMLSRCYESTYWEYFNRSPSNCSLALESAQRALAIDPELVEGQLALGYCYYHCDQNYEQALAEFQETLIKWPNNADLHSAVGAVLRRFPGQLAEAITHFRTAAELDPRSNLKSFDVGLSYGLDRQYDSADYFLDRTILLQPDWDLPYIYKAWLRVFRDGDRQTARAILRQASGSADLSRSRFYWWLSRIVEDDYKAVLATTRPGHDTAGYYLHVAQLNRLMGESDRARAYSDSARILLEDLITQFPEDPRYLSQLGLAHAGIGDLEPALQFGQQAVALLPTTRDAFDGLFLLVNLAETEVMLGRNDQAVELLAHLMTIPGFVSAPYLRVDPLWKPLQQHPDFQRLLAETDTVAE